MNTKDPGNSSSTENDMRYFPRWEVNNRVSYHLEGEKELYTGEIRDMSCAGACMLSNKGVAQHQKVKMTIEIADDVKVQLNGHILWVKAQNNEAQLGITFYDTPDEVQNLILQHAFELDRKKFVKQWYKGWDKS